LLDREGVLSALAGSNLLLMPSEIQENFGMAALEAMAAGVPVLVSPGVPLGYWAERADAGRISACTPENFASTALQMLSNPENLAQMGQRGRQLVQQRFEISRVAQQMLAHCQAIVSTGCPLIESDGTDIFPPRHPLEAA
jgi:glycosyltransferase involved in cell wall biosynthesis